MSNVQRIQDLYAAFGSGDVPAVLDAFDPGIEWREAEGNPYRPSGEAWVGPQAILENLFMRLASEWQDFTVHPGQVHDAGDTVVVEIRYTGSYNASGKSLDAQASHIWKVRDGKVTSFQQYVDTAQLQAVMAT